MTDNFEIVPYETQHGDEMIEFGLNDTLMDMMQHLKKIGSILQELGYHILYWTIMFLSVVAVLFQLGMGNAQGWVIASKRIFKNKIKAARLIKKRTDLLCVNNKIWRLQTAVKADFKIGIRFAEFLGFKNEGLMVGYGPDKTDYYLMARIYK